MKGGGFLIGDSAEIFIPEDFSNDHRMIAQTAYDFAEREVMPRMEAIESQNWEATLLLMKKAGELGLLSVDIPEAYGGLGLDKTSSMLVAENLGRTGSFAVTHGDHTGIGTLPIVYFGNEAQKKKYLPSFATGELISSYSLTEPEAGSDALSMKARAVLDTDGNHYLLNGTKSFLTNGGIADVYIIFAKVDGEHTTAFVIEKGTSGVSLGKEERKMGIKGSSTRTLSLENARVPVENVLGEIGKGHKIAFNILNIGRFKLGAFVVGGAKAVLRDVLHYARERKQFGKTLAEFGMIQHKLAEMAARIFASESMVYRTAGLIDGGMAGLDVSDPVQVLKAIEEYAVECSIIKVYASEALDYVVDEGVQIYGGYGFMEEYPVARPYRDSRINRIFEGTNEINRLLITGMLLKRALKGELPLVAAAQKVAGEILEGVELPPASGILGEELRLLQGAKKVLLFTAGLSVQKHMTRLEEEQEVVGRLSDIIMEIYALESVLVRVKKIAARSGSIPPLLESLALLLANETAFRVEGHAREILAAVSEGDMLRTHLAVLRKLLRFVPANTVALRRKMADSLLKEGSWAGKS